MPTIEKRVIAWLLSEDTGASSMTICAHMVGEPHDCAWPSDAGDLGRCLRLLDLIPEWKPRIKEMATHGPGWAGLCEAWDDIVELYHKDRSTPAAERPRSRETYKAMKLAIANGYRNDSRFECGFDTDGTLSWSRMKE